MEFPLAVLAISLAISVLPPLIFFIIRESVKGQRQGIINDLSAVFDSQRVGDMFIPSFEFVKYKYFIERKPQKIENKSESEDFINKDYSIFAWVVSSIPLIIALFSASLILSSYVLQIISSTNIISCIKIKECAMIFQGDEQHNASWILVFIIAFSGGYIFLIRSFFRAINNFDLSPASFVGAANNLIVGVTVALLSNEALFKPLSSITVQTTAGANLNPFPYIGLVVAFAIGYFPEVATRALITKSKLRGYKRENKNFYDMFFTTPVEVIDGIDTEIRDRLADYHIKSVQNLAAANPLMLFVETPYGVYQIMDWVAQAQLYCSTGQSSLVKLWGLGIRTIFDLERVIFDQEVSEAGLIDMVGGILLADHVRSSIREDGITKDISHETRIANIKLRLNDPHIHRLRQIYIMVGNTIGENNRRFPQRYR
ncbi:hypothetical protein [Methylobacterium sp. E-045]|uniref:hypothetical protein n=1 Tax=Methylobacterium sp. E-045 TaxID=2836575 RepID=UPI001FBABE4C|nr:hypothetical protein [Methylobacterium sp. E-045]MCJ2129142.1 hypothetical protein [Methylobacterium sp. E-045]